MRAATRWASIVSFSLLATGCGSGGATVTPGVANAAPIVTATTASPLPHGETILLLGAAVDPEGAALTRSWTVQTQPPGAAAVVDSPSSSLTEVSGTLPSGTYEFRFEASDGSLSSSAISTVVVEPDTSPTETFVADREAFALVGSVQTTAPDGVSPPFPAPVLVTAYEGGWSGLARARDATGAYVADEFWVIGDRGPNYGITTRIPPNPPAATAFGAGAKYFPLTSYQQKISRLRLQRATGEVEVLNSTGVRARTGVPTVGLPSAAVGMTSADVAYSNLDDKSSLVPNSAVGFDFEGIVEDRIAIAGVDRRVFWTGDEYGPAIQMIEADPASATFGQIIREYVPGVTPDVPNGLFALPASLRQRRDNRGFEGVAATNRAAWAMVQSNLKASFGLASSRLHRFVRVDKATGVSTVYGYDHVADPVALGSTHAGVKVGDLVAIGEREFLVLEHDGALYAHVYRIRVTDATTPLLEVENGSYEKGITAYAPVEKTLVVDLTATLDALGTPTKPEGLVLVDPSTLALSFDNDYGFNTTETEVFAVPADAARNMLVLVRLDQPVVPSIHAVSDYNPGIGTNNCEIPAYDAVEQVGLASCEGDASVQVFDLSTPTMPTFLRRDAIGPGSVTAVATHATRGYYLAPVRDGHVSGNDALQVRRTSDGLLLRTFDLGFDRDPDCVAISPNGRFAVVCNEAENPWSPGSITVLDLGAGPFADAVAAAAGIGTVTEIPMSGLVPSNGAFSTRWYDRIYNTIPAGVTATIAAGNGTINLLPGARAVDSNAVAVADQTDVTFNFIAGAIVVVGKYRFDSPDHTCIFPLTTTALNIEPEYAAFTADSSTCVVTLQENNAVVVLDLTLAVPAIRAVNGVMVLGTVSVPDADTVNGGGTPPHAIFKDLLQKEREPDGIAVATLGGVPCFITADEGDTFGTTPTEASNSRTRGGRTLSVFRLSDGALLGDTGNRLDALVNAAGRWAAFVDPGSRPRRGGSEPENFDVFTFAGRTLAVVGLERANAVGLVDLTDPGAPTVLEVTGIWGLSVNARSNPEGIRAFTSGGRQFVVVGFEISGTAGIFEIR